MERFAPSIAGSVPPTTSVTGTPTVIAPLTTVIVGDTPCSAATAYACGTSTTCAIRVPSFILCWNEAHVTWETEAAPPCIVTNNPLTTIMCGGYETATSMRGLVVEMGSPHNHNNSSQSTNLVLGIVGGIAGALLFCGIFLFRMHARRKLRERSQEEMADMTSFGNSSVTRLTAGEEHKHVGRVNMGSITRTEPEAISPTKAGDGHTSPHSQGLERQIDAAIEAWVYAKKETNGSPDPPVKPTSGGKFDATKVRRMPLTIRIPTRSRSGSSTRASSQVLPWQTEYTVV